MVDFHWGEEPFAVTAGRVGRTVDAVRQRLRWRGLSSALRGRQTIADVARATGYTWHQVAAAVAATGIRPVRTCRTPRGRQTRLSEDQVATVLQHLGTEAARSAARGPSIGDVSRRLGVPRRTAYAVASRLGIRPVRGWSLAPEDVEELAAALA